MKNILFLRLIVLFISFNFCYSQNQINLDVDNDLYFDSRDMYYSSGIFVSFSSLKNKARKILKQNKIKGFDISSRHLEFVKPNEILISHEQKGVYLLKTDETYDQVLSFSETDVKKSIKSSLTKYNNKIYYSANEGVFYLDTTSLNFKKDTILSGLYNCTDYISGKLINANNKLFSLDDKVNYRIIINNVTIL